MTKRKAKTAENAAEDAKKRAAAAKASGLGSVSASGARAQDRPDGSRKSYSQNPTLIELVESHVAWVETQIGDLSQPPEHERPGRPSKQEGESGGEQDAARAQPASTRKKFEHLAKVVAGIGQGLHVIACFGKMQAETQNALKRMMPREQKEKERRGRISCATRLRRANLESICTKLECNTVTIQARVGEARQDVYLAWQSNTAMQDFVAANSQQGDKFCCELPGTFPDNLLCRIQSVVHDSLDPAEISGLIEQFELVHLRAAQKPAPPLADKPPEPPIESPTPGPLDAGSHDKVVKKQPAEVQGSPPKAVEKAWQSHEWAIKDQPALMEKLQRQADTRKVRKHKEKQWYSREIYSHIKENGPEQFADLPSYDAWTRYLRMYEQWRGHGHQQPTAYGESGSIVQPSDIDEKDLQKLSSRFKPPDNPA